ncbi:MAG TPA: zinc dependent phospholipase C family protein [Phnomibacter sp.]|nr:zinc dependent phospholipase C family protein [Phnomibacter sp.]
MKKFICIFFIAASVLGMHTKAWGWGFYGHRKINYMAVFLLPPEMIGFYKTHIDFLSEHAVDPDKRRYAVPEEAPRHYLDLDHYGSYPYAALPHAWNDAVAAYSADSLQAHGIVPWWVLTMKARLTEAFKEKDQAKILKLSAEIGHYIGDAHVPLHASQNHNGQLTNQEGIHAFWESRIPELFADKQYDFFIGKAGYIAKPSDFIWARVLESAAAADTVLRVEAELSKNLPADAKFSFEERQGKISRQYATGFSAQYQEKLNGMIERRMRQSIYAVASFWYTAWVDAGQPDLKKLVHPNFTAEELSEFELLNASWQSGKALGKICD